MNISLPPISQLGSAMQPQPAIQDVQFEMILQNYAMFGAPELGKQSSPDIISKTIELSDDDSKAGAFEAHLPSGQPKANQGSRTDLKSRAPLSAEIAPLLNAVQDLAQSQPENGGTEWKPEASTPTDLTGTNSRSPVCLIPETATSPAFHSTANNNQGRPTFAIPMAVTKRVAVPATASLPTEEVESAEGLEQSTFQKFVAITDHTVAPQPSGTVRSPYSLPEQPRNNDTFSNVAAEPDGVMLPAPTTFQLSSPISIQAPSSEVIRRTDLPQLDLIKDSQWLDTLTRDIAASAARDGTLQFRLVPDFLGAVDIGLVHDEGFVDIHVETTTETAGRIIALEQPKLLEDLRQSGVRIGTLDINGNQQGSSQRQNQQLATPKNIPNPVEIQTPPKRNGRFA